MQLANILLCALLFLSYCSSAEQPVRSRGRGSSKKNAAVVDEDFPTPSTSPTATGGDCQQNDLLNKLLLQLFLSSITYTTQNPLVANLNRLLGISHPQPISNNNIAPLPQTTVLTSTAVSTVTQIFSTVVSVLFKNRRIPTTIYSSSTAVVTEIMYETATVTPIATASTALFRRKRQEIEENSVLESSIIDIPPAVDVIEPTQTLRADDDLFQHDSPQFEVTDVNRWIVALSHPQVRTAWDTFMTVLEQVHINSTTTSTSL